MKKYSILDFIFSSIVIQGLFVGLYRYGIIESLLITLIPLILFTSICVIFGLVVFVMYKYINHGKGKWFNK